MDLVSQEDRCEHTPVDDPSRLEAFVAGGGRGFRFISENYASVEAKVISSHVGDFAKWLRSAHPDLEIEVEHAQRLVLRSNEVWLPLVLLGSDVSLQLYLNMVSSYLYDRLRGALSSDKPPRIQLSAEHIDGETGSVTRFTFSGDHEALRAAIKPVDLNKLLHDD